MRRMRLKTVAIWALSGPCVTFAGCAPRPFVWEAPADHPANPRAAAAPPTSRPDTPALGEALEAASHEDVAGHDHASHAAAASAPSPSTTAPATSQPLAGVYLCPMHPEVRPSAPDQRCPKCGMRLVLKTPDGAHQP